MQVSSSVRDPLVTGGKTVKDVSHDISRQVEGKPTRLWWMAFAVSLAFLGFGFYCICYLLWNGVGVWGLNKTVGWAWDITNFVWWVGIGHAGTLISAILVVVPSTLENVYQQRSGSDDDLRRYLCCYISVHAHGTSVARILLDTAAS